ncbi:MAG: molybdopterin molybdotransferase MoeA [Deltaproteobacteria bacterium]|nr:molybdopterin molybdotransferase MoeA [Deltaproteobacteria bacterium]
MVAFEEALRRVLDAATTLGCEKAPITGTLGRILGEDIIAARDIPSDDNSAMDGFAVKAADTKGAEKKNPVSLEVVEDIPAGRVPAKSVGSGQAARIMTGALIPRGADAVVPVENTESAEGKVAIHAEAKKGEHLRRRGEDVKKGELVIPRGKVVRPPEIGMMASLGIASASIYRKPTVAIIATGDEIVDISDSPPPGAIISSNSYSLYAQVMECGGVPVSLGISKDTKDDLLRHFREALRADIVVSSGGVSMGAYDFVRDVMKEIGATIQFWQVAQRPGKPVAFGTMEKTLFFGLPGNPVSSMITFEEYVRPAILKMSGHANLFRKMVKARLSGDFEKKKGLRYFARVRVTIEEGEYRAALTGSQGSGILKSMVEANAILVIPEEVTALKQGDFADCQLIDEPISGISDMR